MKAVAVVVSMLTYATVATAQSQISGHVQGEGERPLSGVRISMRDSANTHAFEATTDKAGNFVVMVGPGVRPGLFYLRAEVLGYATIERAEFRVAQGEPLEVTVEMDQAAIDVQPLDVIAKEKREFLTGYNERAAQIKHGSGGYIIDRAQLARDGNLSIGRVLASVPGLRLETARRGTGETVTSTRGNCQPRFYIDGTPMIVPDVSNILASTLEGVEIYNGLGQGPAEYFDRSGCGIVLMWSRRGERGTVKGYPIIGLSIVGATVALLVLLGRH